MDSYTYTGEDPEEIDIDAVIAALYSLLFEQDYASSTDDLSAEYFYEDNSYKKAEHIFENGYVEVINVLADGLDIILNKEVSTIEYPEDGGFFQKKYD